MEAENGGAIMELIDSAKSLVARNWKWLVPVGGVAVVGAVMYSRRKP